MLILTGVGDGHTLRSDAAASLARARRDGAPAGCITSSTRSIARQQELYDHQGDPGWPALAAKPSESKHVWRPDDPVDQGARAIDCKDPLRSWLVTRPAYGWLRTIKKEPWHFEYASARDSYLSAPAQEDDMTPEQDNLLRHIVAMVGEVPARTSAAVWDYRLAKADETPVAAKAWLVDTRLIVGQLTSGGGVAALSDADLDRIARACANESDRRTLLRVSD
jgi:hypothetical protein